LFSFLDRVAGQTRLKDRIAYMKPSTATPKNSPFKISTVEMKLQAITLEQLVAYLYKVETSENAVHIKRISLVKAGKNKSLITAIMEIESFKI
jgi:general secretion pathway protein M